MKPSKSKKNGEKTKKLEQIQEQEKQEQGEISRCTILRPRTYCSNFYVFSGQPKRWVNFEDPARKYN